MTASSNGRGGLGWVVLAAALAIPSVLFYNWWSRLKAEQDKATAAKARGRLPDGGVFQPAPDSGRLVNPMASVSTAAAAAPELSSGAAASSAAPAPGEAAASAPVSDPVPEVQAPAAPPSPAVPAAAVPAQVVLPRDPMMSPMDVVRLHAEELAREKARRLIEEAARAPAETRRAAPRRLEPPIDGKIELQGIVTKPDGDSLAIVNNATMNAGESFSVSGFSAKVKVVRITAVGVTFEYKGRRFTKSVNKD